MPSDLFVAGTFRCYMVDGKKQQMLECKYYLKALIVRYILWQQAFFIWFAGYLTY